MEIERLARSLFDGDQSSRLAPLAASMDDRDEVILQGVSGRGSLRLENAHKLVIRDAPGLTGLDLVECRTDLLIEVHALPSLRWLRLPAGDEVRVLLIRDACSPSISLLGQPQAVDVQDAGDDSIGTRFYKRRLPSPTGAWTGVSVMSAGQRAPLNGLGDLIVFGGDCSELNLSAATSARRILVHGVQARSIRLPESQIDRLWLDRCGALERVSGQARISRARTADCPRLASFEPSGQALDLDRVGGHAMRVSGTWHSVALGSSGLARFEVSGCSRLNLVECPHLIDLSLGRSSQLHVDGEVGDMAAALSRMARNPGSLARCLNQPGVHGHVYHRLLDNWIRRHAVPERRGGKRHWEVMCALLRLSENDADRSAAWQMIVRIEAGPRQLGLVDNGQRHAWLRGVHAGLQSDNDSTFFNLSRQFRLYGEAPQDPIARGFARALYRAGTRRPVVELAEWLSHAADDVPGRSALEDLLVELLDAPGFRKTLDGNPDDHELQQDFQVLAAWAAVSRQRRFRRQVAALASRLASATLKLRVGLLMMRGGYEPARELILVALSSGDALPERERGQAMELFLRPAVATPAEVS